jgi:DNA-binding Lrp family transcriptional regulator
MLENVNNCFTFTVADRFMSIAFVLINTDLGEGSDVSQTLRSIPEVKEVYGVYGVYDFVVRLEADSMQELKDVITSKIRRLNHVRSTLTMIVLD